MTGRELHEMLRAAGIYEVGSAPAFEGRKIGLAEPYDALAPKQRDALERAAGSIAVSDGMHGGTCAACGASEVDWSPSEAHSYPAAVESPIDPPTISGTSVTKDVGR